MTDSNRARSVSLAASFVGVAPGDFEERSVRRYTRVWPSGSLGGPIGPGFVIGSFAVSARNHQLPTPDEVVARKAAYLATDGVRT